MKPFAEQASWCEHLCECSFGFGSAGAQQTVPMEVCFIAPEQWFLQSSARRDFALLRKGKIYLQRACDHQAAGSARWCFTAGRDFALLTRAKSYLQRACDQVAGSTRWCFVCFVGFCIVSAGSDFVFWTGCSIC